MGWRRSCLVVMLATAFALHASGAEAKRVALIFGNEAYREFDTLSTPVRDATSLDARLSELGFDTYLYTDMTMSGMLDALQAFRTAATGADVAIVYYAGHGQQALDENMRMQNYLFPIDSRPDQYIDLERHAISINDVLNIYLQSAEIAQSLVLIDAGRDSDLGNQLAFLNQTLPGPRGFSPDQPMAIGDLDYEIWYSTQAHYVASHGIPGANSLFASALLAALDVPGLNTDDIYRRVAAIMQDQSESEQQPVSYGRLSEPVVLNELAQSTRTAEEVDASITALTLSEALGNTTEQAVVPEGASAAAIAEDSAGLSQGPDTEMAVDQIEALAMVQWGRRQLEAGLYEGALTTLEEALELDPNNLDGWMTLGLVHLALGNYDQALKELERVRSARPADPTVLIGIGDALINSARLGEAAVVFEMALVLAETNKNADAARIANTRINTVIAALTERSTRAELSVQAADAWDAVRLDLYESAAALLEAIKPEWPNRGNDTELINLAGLIAHGLSSIGVANDLFEHVLVTGDNDAHRAQAEDIVTGIHEARAVEAYGHEESAALSLATQIPASALQWALKALGHYLGRVDGSFGQESRTAARAYQAAIGAEQTGELSNDQRVRLILEAAEAGQAESQNTLGIMYATGVGVVTNTAEARRWFELAVDQGFIQAEINLSKLIE